MNICAYWAPIIIGAIVTLVIVCVLTSIGLCPSCFRLCWLVLAHAGLRCAYVGLCWLALVSVGSVGESCAVFQLKAIRSNPDE